MLTYRASKEVPPSVNALLITIAAAEITAVAWARDIVPVGRA
jgi:hypothetical protein